MSNMKNNDLIMLGIIFGIIFFFIGAIVANVFPSSETDLLPYKFSAIFKLIGIGVLTCSMVVGGIITDRIDHNLKILLLLLGLILLIVYTIGSPSLEWYSSGMMGAADESYESRPTGYGIPGFELVVAFAALAVLCIWQRKKLKKL